jgi:hypothetical protein
METERGPGRRVRPFLLVLLWIWAVLIFGVVDLFRNVPEFDRVRPKSRLYEGMRKAAHRMVGEPYAGPAAEEAEDDVAVVARRPDAPDATEGNDAAPRPGHRDTRRVVRFYAKPSRAPRATFTEWNDPGPRHDAGTVANGRREGAWTWKWPDGTTRETREYRGGRLHGKVVSFDEQGRREVEETYRDGRRHGTWRAWFPNGGPAACEHYENGELHGTVETWHETGAKALERNYEHGVPEGRETAWHANGQKARTGIWKHGRREGLWLGWDEQGRETMRAAYLGGVLNG